MVHHDEEIRVSHLQVREEYTCSSSSHHTHTDDPCAQDKWLVLRALSHTASSVFPQTITDHTKIGRGGGLFSASDDNGRSASYPSSIPGAPHNPFLVCLVCTWHAFLTAEIHSFMQKQNILHNYFARMCDPHVQRMRDSGPWWACLLGFT